MSLKILSQLNGAHLAQIKRLSDECAAHDNAEYSLYTGEDAGGGEGDDIFALFYIKKALVGYAFWCEGTPAELSGAVLPDFRGRHIFTRMAKALIRKAPNRAYEFSGRDGYCGFAECAAALGAVYRHEEHLMRFAGDSLSLLDSERKLDCEELEDTLLFSVEGKKNIGRVTLFYDGELANICNVYVEPEHRGRGVGFSMLCYVLRRLSARGVKQIILQVSGGNKPALALYAKCGFEITDSVVFYSSRPYTHRSAMYGSIQDSYSP